MVFATLLAVNHLRPAEFNQHQLLTKEPTWQIARQKINTQIDSPWMTRIQTGETSINVLKHGPSNRPKLALTFDDGPHGKVTYDLLKLLKKEHVKATFFVVGQMTQTRHQMLQQMNREGHEIANHSFSHPDLAKLDLLDILTEYKATQLAVEEITGKQPRYCRPPGGRIDEKTLRAASALGLTTVYWNSNPGDYKFTNPNDILLRLRQARQNGSIILLHSGLPATVDALRTFIPESIELGFDFVLLDEWTGNETSSNPNPIPIFKAKPNKESHIIS